MGASERLLQALAVTAELTGTQLSEPAARVMASDLARYPEHQVVGALTRCRKELKGRLTVADVVNRLDDGRPAPEEAWAMLARSLNDEGVTVVWTEEMATAFGVAIGLQDDPVAARMAFKEAYVAAVQKARDEGLQAKWMPSLGHDSHGREGPLLDAVSRGRLQLNQAAQLLPYRGKAPSEVVALIREKVALLPAPQE